MTVRRRGHELLAWVEDSGGLRDLRATVRLGARVRYGGQGVRMPIPALENQDGIPFCVGFEGHATNAARGPRRLRRWAGGLPYGLRSGAPGRLLLEARA